MTKVVIYGSDEDKKKISLLLKDEDDFSIVSTVGSIYQQERNFIYGNSAYGYAVAVICVSQNNPIPFGVLSQDIIKKQLPMVFIVKNNAEETFYIFECFLNAARKKIKENYAVESFNLEQANYVKIVENFFDINFKFNLIKAITSTYLNYDKQPAEKKTVRKESVKPTSEELNEKRKLFFQKKIGNAANSFDIFKAKFDPNFPTISFFGVTSPPKSNVCKWAAEIKNYNLLYGLMGAKNDILDQQSMMYQFAWYARLHCKIFGTIPFEQAKWEENRDFSELNLESFFITEDLEGRIHAFDKLGDLVIVGSCGTGTYEEVLDLLRTNSDRPILIINDDKSNSALIEFLQHYKHFYSNITEVCSQDAFKSYVIDFYKNFLAHKEHAAALHECEGLKM